MNAKENISFLFDLDGVIFDTEGQYTLFWSEVGLKYKSDADLDSKIKGMTLPMIFETQFKGETQLQQELAAALERFEGDMEYNYIAGAKEFIEQIASSAYPMAIVTSSNRAKMEHVYKAHPYIKKLFTRIFTGEDFARSKPAPDCYLLGMESFNTTPERSIVFEDSVSGLKAARSSQAWVVGLTTTNSAEVVKPYSDLVIDDFTQISLTELFKKLNLPNF